MRGVVVDGSAIIHPKAIFEPSGGKIHIGARTFIDVGVIVRSLGGFVKIGDDCSVNAYSALYGGGGLTIGDNTRIAAHTVIVPSNHVFSNADALIKDQGLQQLGITIENDVWIGAGVRVLDGVVLGRGCVVGAGAVVTKSVLPLTVVGGVPAKQIACR
ncbi:acyltransferase [Henriciella marina]|uniref:acyltransferase n=1 Tax=Henriciella marina TaxID=453851 RepID=UPI001F3BA8CB|nr:acyltransferase [Henriciella marina]